MTPATEVPTTESPTTEAPTTESPTTEAPTTEAPAAGFATAGTARDEGDVFDGDPNLCADCTAEQALCAGHLDRLREQAYDAVVLLAAMAHERTLELDAWRHILDREMAT